MLFKALSILIHALFISMNNQPAVIPAQLQLALPELVPAISEIQRNGNKRGKYSKVPPARKLFFARRAADIGAQAVLEDDRYKDEGLKYGSVQGWCRAYKKKKRELLREPTAKECGFENKPKSLPLLGPWDRHVKQACEQLRSAGTAINGRILGATITAVLCRNAPHLLIANGGAIDPNSRGLWASMFARWGWVMRRATSSRVQRPARQVVEQKREFVAKMNALIQQQGIRDELVINWDELSADVIPAADYTMEVRGVGIVKIAGNFYNFLCFSTQPN